MHNIIFLVLVGFITLGVNALPSFKIDTSSHQFMLDGKPFRFLSGGIHYFRIPKHLWEDRLKRVRAMGFNAITVPVPWNLHQYDKDSFPDFSGNLNLLDFLELASDNDLYTLIQLGPYISDEWENGGLPWWLIKNTKIAKYRSSDPAYFAEVTQWWNFLLPMLKPLTRKEGGPILMAQIEHYYGSSGICDQLYMTKLANLAKQLLGEDVVLFTADMPMLPTLKCGTTPGVLPTIELSPNSDPNAVSKWFEQQQLFANGAPRVASQFLLGPYQLWGTSVKNPYPENNVLASMQAGWALNASMSFHMAHGGTNFGFWNGKNDPYPVTTSHDGFAPITEGGLTTSLFLAIRNFISKIPGWTNPPTSVPWGNQRTIYNPITLSPVDYMINFVKRGKQVCWPTGSLPKTAEDMNQGYGFLYYQTNIAKCGSLVLSKYADDAYIFLNGKYVGALYNQMANIHNNTISLQPCNLNANQLEIIIEISGRTHLKYPSISKGLQGVVSIDNNVVQTWKNCRIPFGTTGLNTVRNYQQIKNQVSKTLTTKVEALDTRQPAVFVGTLNIENSVMDTFIDTRGWGKGFITFNDYNIGRYWSTEGPQQTLYVPSSFIKWGSNTVMFYEFQGAREACKGSSCTMKFSNQQIFSY